MADGIKYAKWSLRGCIFVRRFTSVVHPLRKFVASESSYVAADFDVWDRKAEGILARLCEVSASLRHENRSDALNLRVIERSLIRCGRSVRIQVAQSNLKLDKQIIYYTRHTGRVFGCELSNVFEFMVPSTQMGNGIEDFLKHNRIFLE